MLRNADPAGCKTVILLIYRGFEDQQRSLPTIEELESELGRTGDEE